MTELTPSQIGQIRTRVSWILAEAEIAKSNSGLLGRRGTDEGVVLSELCTTLDGIAVAAKRAKKMIQGVKEKRSNVRLDKEQEQVTDNPKIDCGDIKVNREETILKACNALMDIVESLDLMQHDLAKLDGFDDVAYGPIARAMGIATEALVEIKKKAGPNDPQ